LKSPEFIPLELEGQSVLRSYEQQASHLKARIN
jgi:hypothetical protein